MHIHNLEIDVKRWFALRKWSNSILKKYLLKVYVINENRTLIVKLINKVETMDERLINVENTLSSKNILIKRIFYNGEIYDAKLMYHQYFFTTTVI